jgi:hypothetical protein
MTQQKPALIVDQVVHDALAIWPVGDHVPGRSARAIRTDATVARFAYSRTCTGYPDSASTALRNSRVTSCGSNCISSQADSTPMPRPA